MSVVESSWSSLLRIRIGLFCLFSVPALGLMVNFVSCSTLNLTLILTLDSTLALRLTLVSKLDTKVDYNSTLDSKQLSAHYMALNNWPLTDPSLASKFDSQLGVLIWPVNVSLTSTLHCLLDFWLFTLNLAFLSLNSTLDLALPLYSRLDSHLWFSTQLETELSTLHSALDPKPDSGLNSKLVLIQLNSSWLCSEG